MYAQVFLEPPADYSPKIEVVTCYLRSGNEILFVKRRPDKSQGNLWGIPGGKLDKDKPLEEELIREMKEETSLDLSSQQLEPLGTLYLRYPTFDYTYHMFGVFWQQERPHIILNSNEHVDYAWWSLKEGLAHPLILFEDACTFLVWNHPFFEGCEKPLLHVPVRV